jgi:hypothetical protein
MILHLRRLIPRMEVLIFIRKKASLMKHREVPESADEGDIQAEYSSY